jgi:iron complex transport system ATP-binding protein
VSLRLKDVRWSVDGRAILNGVTAIAPGGRLTGLLGPNGAGKSSLLRAVAGVLDADAGEVTLDGARLLTLTRRERARQVALVEQEATASMPLTVAEAVLIGRTPHTSRWGAMTPEDDAVVAAAIAEAGVGDLADRSLSTLSGGERQRAHLARALAQEPHLLLLDEPTNHLDVHARIELLDLLTRLTDRGVTVLAALHDLNLTAAACDHVILLDAGRVVAEGSVDEVLRPEVLEPVYRVRCHLMTHPETGRPVLTFSQGRACEVI